MQVPFDPKTLRVFANEGSRAGMSRPDILKYVGLVFFSGGVLFVFNARTTRTGFADWLLVSRRITRNAAILCFHSRQFAGESRAMRLKNAATKEYTFLPYQCFLIFTVK